ncbi:hypothetical protein FJT64_022280 [Amphibalanus amphitrite]|uniref:Integrase catalytic domain-containing protein n=1 Tax=Amphibalanus amphitrite TaxID=1232801 RepID=A0A6A4WQY1_AMPAM|nr:hypothetical protein FJT64_022280 [Amphibalanus amphitrite]
MSGRRAEYDRRAAVLQALRAGRSPAEIIEFLRVPRSTVYRIAKRVRAQEGGGDGEDEGEVTPERKKRNSTQSRLCLMSEQHGRRSLLPTTSVVICACGEAEVARALIDHGSQASYISQALAEKLKLEEKGHEETFTVKTCIGTEEKRHRVVTCEIAITPKRMIKAEFLIDPNMDLSYNLPGVSRAVKQLQDEGVILADCFYRDQETDDIDNIHCLLGVNVLSDLTPLRTVSLGQSVAYEVDKGHIIFGDLAGLVPDHLSHLSGPTSEPTPEDEEELLQTINETNINIKQQDQHRTTPEEQTQASTTLRDEDEDDVELTAADEHVLEDFKSEVEFRDGKYFVKIPFYSNVEEVPENFDNAMALTDRVHQSLQRKNLVEKYSAVFQQQVNDGIIEEIDLSVSKRRVFIPHHPVIKTDEQTTTKIRPVFNCSFKTTDSPSLNDACFPGVNLLTNMTSLLQRFRTNKFMMMADIEKAFLQVHLKYESDQDHFCFLWKTEEGVKGYRFKTILFGLNASPFILNHILQLHLQRFRETETISALKQSLYVDNFLYTSSDLDKLTDIYHEITIRGRILMKQVWDEGTDWDEEVSSEVKAVWAKLRVDLEALQSLTFPRQTADLESDDPITLHVFCDGSRSCYGVACYIKQGEKTSLVYSHSKLAPDKKSIPQTELLAVLMALDCVSTIATSLNIKPDDVFVWCDAQVVLEWLHSGTKTKSRFTINRLKTAQQKKKDLETLLNCEVTFRYVNTLDNVADMVTRGISYREFERSMLTWLSGPSWLADTDAWPQNTLNCLSEATKRAMQVNTNLTEQHDPDTSQQLLDPGKYSSLKRLYGVTARVYHFINKLKGRQVDCYKQAEDYWIRRMQQKSFPAELRFLREKENQASKPPPKLVNDLNLFLDDVDILRCKGRLSRLNYYSYSTLNPVLLAKEHQLTSLLINDQHLKCKHLGIGTTLTALRERGFWIPAGRQVVKRILKDCITCKKHNSLAFSYPKLTDLPKERVRFLKPYHDTAIDYTGHIFVKDDNGEMKKVYIVLYTDLAIRSVHLDVVPDLTVKSFIQSFSRFCSIYRVPHTLYTDNASYFIAAQRLMENFFLSDDFREHLARLNIIHKTIPAYASWVGGIYERQVKTIKQCLHKTVGRAKLTYYELITHLAAIQDIVNGRPITYVNSQLEEIEPLTPNKILKVHSNPRLRLICEDDRDDPLWTSTPDDVHRQMNNTLQEQQRLQDKYTKMWYSDYLLSLRETSRDVFQSEWIDKISVGDIVLIDTRDRPRVYWQMGRVLQLIHSNDGRVRQVILKTAKGQVEWTETVSGQNHQLTSRARTFALQDERQVDRGNWFRI